MRFYPNMPKAIEWFPGLTSGLMMTLAFPATGMAWIAWVALVPFMISIRTMKPGQAFGAGIAFGLAHYLSLIYWIVPTIHHYGDLPLILAVPVLFVLCLYLSLYSGCFAMIVSTWHPSPFIPLGAAALWTGLEFLRATLLTGFPWGLLGYTQYTYLPIIQIADIAGVYGVSFLIVLTGGTLSLLWQSWKKDPESESIKTLLPLMVLILALGAAFGYGKLRLVTIGQAGQTSDKTRISLIQGNIDQTLKWDTAYQETTVQTYCDLSRAALSESPDLVIWPETALPFYYSWDKELSGKVDGCVRQGKSWFLFGSPAFKQLADGYAIYNRAYMLNRTSLVTGTYDKIHLVPFGEYIPFGSYLGFLGKLTQQAGDFSPGPEHVPPLKADRIAAGILICFESIFAPLARDHVAMGANILVIMTNDAWFGRTAAASQHFSICVFRAVENRRSVARAANTGISGFVDPSGAIVETTDLFTTTQISRSMPCLETFTAYTTLGDMFALICLGAALAYVAASRLQPKRGPGTPWLQNR